MTVQSQPKKQGKKKKKNRNPRLAISNFDIARWFIQENLDVIPVELSKGLLGAFRARDLNVIRKLASRYGSPQLYEDHQTYFVVAQLFALLTKVPYPFGGGDPLRKAVALSKFLLSEKRCRITSRKLDYYNARPDREDPTMRILLSRARGLVDSVLGNLDSCGLGIIDEARFGPGMTFCSSDPSATTPYYKLTQVDRSVTRECLPYADLMVRRRPVWAESLSTIDFERKTVKVEWNVVTSCRLTFVPKDERTFRTIAIEPFGNVCLQLGVHEYLRKRLKSRANIDIENQCHNQRAAQFGSENWDNDHSLSTIDLSSASDCVSPGLVRRLVRPQWLAFLDDLRTKSYIFEDVEVPLSKWSSMGNGYTFALETLLFWALAQVCEDYCGSGNKALAYGDDIIVSKRASLLTLQVLHYTGFILNRDKSFINGPFRESCGADFHAGVDVRPTFLKVFKPKVTECFSFINQLKVNSPFSTDLVFKSVVDAIPEELICWGPPSLSVDTHLHAPWFWLHKKRPKGFRWDQETQRQYHHSLVFRPKSYGGSMMGSYLTWLYNTRQRELLGEDNSSVQITRRSRGFYRVRSTPCSVLSMAVRDYFFLTWA